MNLSKIRITDAQNLLLQGLLSVLGAALVGSIIAIAQYILKGNYILSDVLTFALGTLVLTFGNALKNFVPSRINEELQALKDFQMQAQTLLAGVTGGIGTQNNTVASPTVQAAVAPPLSPQPIQGPLVIVNHPGAQQSAVEVAYQQALQAQAQQPQSQAQPLQGVVQDVQNTPASIPQPQVQQMAPMPMSFLMDNFPSNPVMPAQQMASLTSQNRVQQVPFPPASPATATVDMQDTLTGVQAAQARQAGQLL